MTQVIALQQVVTKESSGFVKVVLETAVALSPTSDIAKMALEMLSWSLPRFVQRPSSSSGS